ncbi:MAG: glycosyltransferase [Candidatus Omnitrophota bacterium]|nr:glycosyltransferase [Candidatus Omnitrophota bacterium]
MNQPNNPDHIPLSIISPVHNNGGELEGLLNSLKDDFKRNPSLEMIVVDDCSSDDSVARAVEKFSFVKLIRLERNRGAAAARNAGARAASRDILVFIDSDVQAENDAIQRIEDAMRDKFIKVMACNKSKIPANKGIFPSYRAIMHNSWVPKGKYATFFTGAFGVMRKEVFDEIGGFDEGYRGASVEDFEFGHRLAQKYQIYFFKDILIRVNWNLFKKTMKNHYQRTVLWMQLFKKRKKFDNFCATPSQGTGYILGFLVLVSFPLIFLGPRFALLSLALTLIYLSFNRRFFVLTAKEKGLVFMLIAIGIHLSESLVVTAGSIKGLFTAKPEGIL